MDGLPPAEEEGHSQPLGEDSKQGIVKAMVKDSKDNVNPKEEAKTAMAGDIFHVDSKNAKMELKTEQDLLDSLKILEESLPIKSDLITAGGDAGAACCASPATTFEKPLDSLSCNKQDRTMHKEGAVVGGCKVLNNVGKSVEFVKTKLEETKAAKDRLDNTLNFVGAEANVAALDATVREMVSAAEPQLQAGLDALTALAAAPIAALSLIKHTHLLETAARLCQYTPLTPSANRPTRSTEPGMEQAMKITNEAEQILGRMMSLLNVPDESDFWPAVEEMAKKFEEQTKDMTTDQIYLLTEYTEGGNTIEAASSTLPKMYPMSINDRRDMEGFADDESDPEQVQVLKEVATNKQTGRKSKKRMISTKKDKDHRNRKMKENRKKSKLVQKKSSTCRPGTSDSEDPTYELLMSDAQRLQSSNSD